MLAPHRRAIDLARREYPAVVIEVEEEWGDWLMTQKQMDAAINHFIEAGRYALCCREKAGGRFCRDFASGAECELKCCLTCLGCYSTASGACCLVLRLPSLSAS